MASYGDYVYYGDDSGVLQCVDVNTMQAVWAMDLGESMMCTPALETDDDGGVYLYTGTALSRTERSAQVRLLKIDALTGDIAVGMPERDQGQVRQQGALQAGSYAGLMASPLVGEGDINDLVIFNVNRVELDDKSVCAVVYALDKDDGRGSLESAARCGIHVFSDCAVSERRQELHRHGRRRRNAAPDGRLQRLDHQRA